ncbi:permease [Methanosarcina sp. A14]|nr:permease [Methanosarcina sp. A14]
MNSTYFYALAFIFLTVSYLKDKKRTKIALLKAWKSFSGILPEILSVMMFAGITLAILSPDIISKLIGSNSGFFGVVLSLTAGSITMIPGFVAFPLGATLLDAGAGYAQIAAFVSSLMAVGVVTLPLEIKYFSKRMAILRNASALVISLVFTMVIWKLM